MDPLLDWRQIPVQNDDERFMREAIKEACKAYKQKEVPVGAVLVVEGSIIARGYNQVESLKDATAHAEVLCIGAGSQQVNNWRLEGATLYCTLEPCSMCAGALFLSRVKRLVWGAPDKRHGANGSWVNLFEGVMHPTHQVDVQGGVLSTYCAQLMQQFFKERRGGAHVPGSITGFTEAD